MKVKREAAKLLDLIYQLSQVSCTVAMATRLLLLWLGKEMFHPWQFGAGSNQFFVPKVLKNTASNSAGDLFSEGYISDLQLTTSRA